MTSVAVHLGVGSPAGGPHGSLRSPRDSVQRLARISAAVGVRTQYLLLNGRATGARAGATVASAAGQVGPGDLLILSFSGHAERAVPGEHDGGWYLHDRVMRHHETAGLLAAAHRWARVVVIADTCYAASFAAACDRIPARTVLLAACGAGQTVLEHPASEFVTALGRHLVAGPTYAELELLLRADAPDVERPEVHTNRPDTLRHTALVAERGTPCRTDGQRLPTPA